MYDSFQFKLHVLSLLFHFNLFHIVFVACRVFYAFVNRYDTISLWSITTNTHTHIHNLFGAHAHSTPSITSKCMRWFEIFSLIWILIGFEVFSAYVTVVYCIRNRPYANGYDTQRNSDDMQSQHFNHFLKEQVTKAFLQFVSFFLTFFHLVAYIRLPHLVILHGVDGLSFSSFALRIQQMKSVILMQRRQRNFSSEKFIYICLLWYTCALDRNSARVHTHTHTHEIQFHEDFHHLPSTHMNIGGTILTNTKQETSFQMICDTCLNIHRSMCNDVQIRGRAFIYAHLNMLQHGISASPLNCWQFYS